MKSGKRNINHIMQNNPQPAVDEDLRNAFEAVEDRQAKSPEDVDLNDVRIMDMVKMKSEFLGRNVKKINLRNTLAHKKKKRNRAKSKIVKKSRKVNRR